MGWFWTDSSAATTLSLQAPHPIPRDSSKAPPAGCPMHKASSTDPSSGALPTSFPSLPSSSNLPSPPTSSQKTTGGGCPVKHDGGSGSMAAFAQGCPVKHDGSSSSAVTTQRLSSPSPSSSLSSGLFEKINPLNYMPNFSQSRAEGQTHALPTDRETSTIPRGDVDSNWEYPSPQQMYNAMVRKDRMRNPSGASSVMSTDGVESMVAIHNFLNEGAWAEIEEWEARFSRGLGFGWRTCRSGEEGFASEYRAAKREPGWTEAPQPRLLRFMGRPGDLTPKVRMIRALGRVAPAYATDLPFDRHDWFVQRRSPDGSQKEVRYVIDYYSGEPEPSGEPVFYLDVRPAIDGPTAAIERAMRWGGDFWYRASGGATRQ